jgi:hypothetical protein
MAAASQTVGGNITAVPEKRLENSAHRTATDSIHAITESTKQLFAAGDRLAQDLEELSARVSEATEFRAQFNKRPWLLVALTIGGAAVVWSAFSRRSSPASTAGRSAFSPAVPRS